MRMTNKIMQNNSLYNINNNKVLQDKLSTQMSTQKKITRPSDDPVIAIRALRLRSDVTQINQYYKNNAPDAQSWLEVTGDALSTTTAVLTDMIKQSTKGSNEDLTSSDLEIIVTQMEALSDEFYSTGNVDYAGRFVFTGYRTDTSLSFTEDTTLKYNMTEQLTIDSFDQIKYVEFDDLEGLTEDNYTAKAATELDVDSTNMHRLRLAYDNTVDEAPEITFVNTAGVDTTLTPDVVSITSDPNPYQTMKAGGHDAIFIPETGEVLISDDYFDNNLKDLDPTIEIDVTYAKEKWKNGDLRPEHYFACTKNPGTPDEIKYNQDYLAGKGEQVIEYDVGYNQTIRINTTADEIFTHNVRRDVADLRNALNDLKAIEASMKNLKDMKSNMSEGDPQYAKVVELLDAANKAYTYARDKVQGLFENSITRMQGALDATSVAITDNGTRSSRLELISNRLMNQQATFKDLQSENEDADISEVAINLSSAELTYEAALMATGKIMQTSLMNYI